MNNNTKKCNWCNRLVELLPSKPFCQSCFDSSYQECIRCHKPYTSAKYFQLNSTRCNSCHRKYLAEKERRLAKANTSIDVMSESDSDQGVPGSDDIQLSSSDSETEVTSVSPTPPKKMKTSTQEDKTQKKAKKPETTKQGSWNWNKADQRRCMEFLLNNKS